MIRINPHNRLQRAGFTIIEMMVVVAIVVILLAVGFPTMWKLERESRVAQGVNALAVSSSATRAFATRDKANLTSVPLASYSGTALIVAPNWQIRIVENNQAAKNGGNFLESMPFNGYRDIPGRDYVDIPFGVGMILLAGFLIVMGIVEFEPAAVVVGSFFGAGGSGMFWWGFKSLQDRRAGLMTGLQRKVLRLATTKGGMLTVTEVAAELNLALPAAEKVLESMDD